MEEKAGKMKANVTTVKAGELIGVIKKDKPKLFGKLPEEKGSKIVHAALIQLGRQLDAVKEGVVKVPGFGSFWVRQAEREKEGKKETVTKVAFKVAKAKPKKGKKASKKAAE